MASWSRMARSGPGMGCPESAASCWSVASVLWRSRHGIGSAARRVATRVCHSCPARGSFCHCCSMSACNRCAPARSSGTKNQELACGTAWCWPGGPLAKPWPRLSLGGPLMLFVGGANGRVWYLHRFARKDVGWVSSATDPPSFILPKVDGQAPWTVCWAMWRRASLLHGRLIWCDRVAAPEANPLGLPLLRSLVEIWCPVHVSGGEFAPRSVTLGMVVIDQD